MRGGGVDDARPTALDLGRGGLHQRRRISVFAGPPGIGKTTAIDEFSRRRPGEIAVVKVARRNAREVLVLQHTLEALRHLIGSPFSHTPGS